MTMKALHDESSPSMSVHARVAVLMLVIGGLFAVDMFLGWSLAWRLWPLLAMLLGGGLIGIFFSRDRRGAPIFASGVYFICFSALALYCNFTSWSSLSRLWPLFIAFLGISLISVFFVTRRHHRMSLLAGLLLVSCALVFFFVFTIDQRLWWIVFILTGLSVLAAEKAG